MAGGVGGVERKDLQTVGLAQQTVAEVLWKIANDPASPITVPAGADAEAWFAESHK